jgi:hypothetical protein
VSNPVGPSAIICDKDRIDSTAIEKFTGKLSSGNDIASLPWSSRLWKILHSISKESKVDG